MLITTRILPHAEWDKLTGTLLEPVHQHLDPCVDRVIVAELDRQIVGSVLLGRFWHLEAVTIRQELRQRVSVLRPIFDAVRDELKAQNVDEFYTMTTDKDTVPLGTRLGVPTKLNGDHYAVKVCQSASDQPRGAP